MQMKGDFENLQVKEMKELFHWLLRALERRVKEKIASEGSE